MKSSMRGLLLWCLLAGFFSSAFCQAANNASNASISTNKTKELLAGNPAEEDKTGPMVETTSVPTTATSEPGIGTNQMATDPNNTTTTPAPETNTTTTTSTTTTTPQPNTTTPATTTTLQPNTTTTTTTTTSPITTTTPTPIPPTPRPPCNHFDFPSFVGGIVLTLGTLAISLVAYKFYKARNERNYHTL